MHLDAPQDIHQELGNNLESKGINLEHMKPCEQYWSYWSYLPANTDTRQAAFSHLEEVT